jgi:Copper amine oxidase N-terminal domain
MLTGAQPAFGQSTVAVVVNGQQMQFNQPPVERSGRVFVPLRGVFERLGATVVYNNGIINATGNGRNISLQLGSNQATIDGQNQTLDVAPFLVGSSTLVPLRFIAQALGASVDWNNNTSTVTINGNNNNNNSNNSNIRNNRNNNERYQPPQNQFYLSNQSPTGLSNSQNPALHATYSEPISNGSLRVSIDGRDVTRDVYANSGGFDVTPSFALGTGNHQVNVAGTTQNGASFNTGWSFQTGNASRTNFIRSVSPATDSRVQSTFDLSGRTMPGSQVHIVASGQTSALGGLIELGTGTYQTTVRADSNGAFYTTISLNSPQGSQVRVIIQSTAPDGSSREISYTYVV